MKRQVLVGLSTLALSLVALPSFANETVAINPKSLSNVNQITPFSLVTRSYQGSFRNQGIPSGGVFKQQALSGRISPEDLVNVAIANGRLSPETINDRGYLHSVASFLDNFDND